MAVKDDLRTELELAQRNLEAATHQGDATQEDLLATKVKQIGDQLSAFDRQNPRAPTDVPPSTGPALAQQPPVSRQDFKQQVGALSTYTADQYPAPDGPGQGALSIEQETPKDVQPDEWWAHSADGVKKASGALDSYVDNQGATSSDVVKTAAAAVIKQGAQALFERARDAQSTQYARLNEQIAAEPDPSDKVEHAKWRAAIDRETATLQAGGEVDPTFWGTFVRPFLAPTGKTSFGQKLQNLSERVNTSRSEEAKSAEKKPWFPSDEMLSKNFNVADPSTWFEGTAMPWEDLDAFSLQLAAQAPSFGAGFVANRGVGRASAAIAGAIKRAEGILNPNMVRRYADKAQVLFGATAGIATDYMITKEQLESQIHEAIKPHWDDEARWDADPDFAKLVASGVPRETAKQLRANEAAVTGATAAAFISAMGEAPLEKFFAKIGIGEAVSRAGTAVKAGVGGALTNAFQETNEQLQTNWQERKFDPTTPMTKDVINSLVGGMMIGGPVAAAGGALAGGTPHDASLNKDQKKLLESGFKRWTDTANERSKLQAKVFDPDYIKNTPPEQRLKDHAQIEALQEVESKAFLESEPVIRKMQEKYGATPQSKIRVDKFATQHEERLAKIDANRKARWHGENIQQTEEQAAQEAADVQRQIEEDSTKLGKFTQTRDDLATVQEGGVIEEEGGLAAMDRYDRLIDQGYGRWTSNKKNKFVLTPAGRAARDSIDKVINQQTKKVEGLDRYTGPERRSPVDRLADEDYQAMSEEQRAAHYHKSRTDALTGLRRIDALDDFHRWTAEGRVEPPKAVGFVDGDSLGWINKNMSFAAGDAVLKKIGQAFKAAGLADVTYRKGGDEFVVHGDTQEEVHAALGIVQSHLQGMAPVMDEAGRSVSPDITWGTGATEDEADAAMRAAKVTKIREGRRSNTGEPPVSLRQSSASTPPIMSYDGSGEPTETNALIDELQKLTTENRTDEFSRRRLEKLNDRLHKLIMNDLDRTDLSRFAQQMLDSMVLSKSGLTRAKIVAEAKVRWMAMSPEQKAHYEKRAAEFFTPFFGEHVSGVDAYISEQHTLDGDPDFDSKMPSFTRDENGNRAYGENTAAFVALNRLINEKKLPPNVIRDIEEVSAHWRGLGHEDITPADVLMTRVHRWIGIEMMAGGPSPFSDQLEEYKRVAAQFEESAYPLLQLYGDPITGPQFYAPLQKGGRVEIISEGRSVAGTVIKADADSVVVKWDEDMKVFDPDVEKKGDTARFSRRYGWQISARHARGGKSYGRQFGAWPGQARLGRRWNPDQEAWETASDVAARNDRARTVNASKNVMRGLAANAKVKATRNEMRRARAVANQMMAGMGNLPQITLANSVADLPSHMQAKLIAHGSNGFGVQGMFDEDDPRNGVWVLVGNSIEAAKKRGITLERQIAEAVIHETVGHYGLRGWMGNDKTMNQFMDAIEAAFPKEVRAKGRDYGFMVRKGAGTWRGPNVPLPVLMSAEADAIRAMINERNAKTFKTGDGRIVSDRPRPDDRWIPAHSVYAGIRALLKDSVNSTTSAGEYGFPPGRGEITQVDLARHIGMKPQRLAGILTTGTAYASENEILSILDGIESLSTGGSPLFQSAVAKEVEKVTKDLGERAAEMGRLTLDQVLKEANKMIEARLGEDVSPVNLRTIRYWQSSGLLPKIGTRGRLSTYPPHRAEMIVRIKTLQSQGMTVEQIGREMKKAEKAAITSPQHDVRGFVAQLLSAGVEPRAIAHALKVRISAVRGSDTLEVGADQAADLMRLAESNAEEIQAAPPPLPLMKTPGSHWETRSSGEGDLYIARIGPNAGTPSRTRTGPNDIAIKLDKEVLLPDYMYYLFQYLQPKLAARLRGTAQQSINQKDIDEVLREHFRTPTSQLRGGQQESGSADGMEWMSDAHRRLAAEEYLAEMAQLVVTDYGGKMPKPQMNVFQRVANYIRNWMVRKGYGRFMRGPMKFTDNDIAMIIWNAQNFVRNGKGWAYQGANGNVLTPFMQDKAIFRSAIVTQIEKGVRPTTKQERAQMVAAGNEPVATVPLFPEFGTRQHYTEIFEKLVKDGKIKKAELDSLNIVRTMSNMTTWDQVMGLARMADTEGRDAVMVGADALPAHMRKAYVQAHMIAREDREQLMEDLRNAKERLTVYEEEARQGTLPHVPLPGEGDILPELLDSFRGIGPESRAQSQSERTERVAALKGLIEFLEKEGSIPTFDQQQAARVAMDDIRQTKLGPKDRIPLAVVQMLAETSAVKVRVMPDNPYRGTPNPNTTREEIERSINTDITPESWPTLRPAKPDYYAQFRPMGRSNFDEYGAYLFYQDNPAFAGRVTHTRFRPVGGYDRSFMHFRYAESKLQNGDKAYEVIEVQSDPFQGTDHQADTQDELREAERTAKSLRARLDRVGYQMMKRMSVAIGERVTKMHNDLIEAWKDTEGRTPAEVVVNRARLVGDLETQRSSIYNDALWRVNEYIDQRITPRMTELERDRISSDDARAFEYLDKKALSMASGTVANWLEFMENNTSYNPAFFDNGIESEISGYTSSKEERLHATEMWHKGLDRLGRMLAGNETLRRAVTRVMAKPHLYAEFMNNVVAPVLGLEREGDAPVFSPEKIERDRKDMTGVSTRSFAKIPFDIAQIISGMRPDVSSFETLRDAVEKYKSELQAAGVDVNTLHYNYVSGDLVVDAYTDGKNNFPQMLKHYLSRFIESGVEADWQQTESNRVREVRDEISRMEGAALGNVSDMIAAMAEIDYGGNSWYPENIEYADRAEWVDSHIGPRIEAINNGDWNHAADYYEETLYYDGDELDADHPGYLELVESDDDGNVTDTDDADAWLDARTTEARDALWESDGSAYEAVEAELRREFNENYGQTRVNSFSIATAWDTDGDATDRIRGFAVKNEVDPDTGDIDSSWRLTIDDNFIDYYDSEEDMETLVSRWVIHYYQHEGITPPEDSQFYHPINPVDVPESLRQQLNPRDPPDFGDILAKVAASDFDSGKPDEQEVPELEKMWEAAVRLEKMDRVKQFPSPLSRHEVWVGLAAKFAVADAIRKGAKHIIWQGGEGTAGRGGWGEGHSGYWVNHSSITWEVTAYDNGSGNPKPVYVITDSNNKKMMLDKERLLANVGADVARLIIARSNVKDNGEDMMKTLAMNYQVAPNFSIGADAGSVNLINVRAMEVMSTHANLRDASVARSEAMRVGREDMDANGRWGKITRGDVGGAIAVATPLKMDFENYEDTIVDRTSTSGGAKLRGARTGYDVSLTSGIRKVVEKYGGKVEDNVKSIQPSQVRLAVETDAARRVVDMPHGFAEEYPNIRVENMAGVFGWGIVSDKGPVLTTIWDSEINAQEYLDDFLTRVAAADAAGIKVYSVKITDEMVKAYGNGDIPIMAQSSKDYIASNPILAAAAKRIGQTVIQRTLRQRVQDLRRDWSDRWQQGMFDKFHGIKAAMKKVDWRGPAELNPYIHARLTTSLDTQMRAVLEHGAPIWKDGIMQTTGKGLLEILEPVGNDLEAWGQYMAGVRAKRLMSEGRENNFTAPMIVEMEKLGKVFPHFVSVAKEYAAFNKAVLDFAEQAGVIDATTRPTWEHADYVPFYRVQDNKLSGPMAGSSGIANVKKQIKQLKGGKAPLQDITTNIMQNTANLIEASMKNHASLTAVDALKGLGVMHKIPLDMKPEIVPLAQVRALLIKAGINPSVIPPGALQGFQTMFAIKAPEGPGKFSLLRNGKREYYETDDLLLYEAMTQINKKMWGTFMNVFRGPKRALTLAITLDPGFMVRNFARDLLSAFTIGRDKYEPFTRAVQGFKQAMLKDESMRTMMSAGAAFDSGYLNSGDPGSVRRAIKKARRMKNKNFADTVLDTPGKLFDAYKALGSGIENANRVAVYNAAIAAGKSKAQAVYEAKDLMDFSMGGSWPPVQFLIQSVPFMGARLQGLHRMGRGMAENPVGFTVKGLLVGMAGMALYAMFRDDERYKELEEWDRDTYFHWWKDGNHYRLPKPFEVGVVFNTIPERMFDYLMSEEGDAGKLLFQRFGFALTQTFSVSIFPQTLQPGVESWFNRNSFTQRDIVTPYEEERMPPEQMRAGTSPTFVEMARALPSWLDSVSPKLRSPLHLENLYRGYLGTLGQYALLASDAIVSKAMDYPEKPTKQIADMPVVGSFYRGTEADPRRTKYEEVFYDLVRQVSQVQGSLTYLKKIGNEPRVDLLNAEQEPLVSVARSVGAASSKITKINANMMRTYMDGEMDPDTKRAEIDSLQRDKNEIFKEMYELRPGGAGNLTKPTAEDLDYLLQRFKVNDIANKLEKRQPAMANLVRDLIVLPKDVLMAVK